MKRLILFFLVFFPISLIAQNWRNICSPGKTFYFADSGKMAAFRLDSAVVTGPGDTAYFSYRMLRGPNGVCLDSLHGSLLGNKVLGKADGRFCFFNYANDSLWINTHSRLHDSWNFYNASGGSAIIATVSDIRSDTILGMVDSIKVISLTSLKSGINAAIRLSKHNGLCLMPDVYMVPAISGLYSLAGKTSPEAGFQQCISWQDIYNFSAGDEFHYYHRKDIGYPRHFDTTEIRKVLAVAWSKDSGSVNYIFRRCMHIQHIWEYAVDTTYADTVDWQYSFTPGWENTFLNKLPNEKDGIWLHQLFYKHYNQRAASFSRYGEYWFNPADLCWESGTSGGVLVHANYTYAPGLGMTGYSSDLHSMQESLILEYYRKGNETWGTPVEVDCRSSGAETNMKLPKIMIRPNPATDRFLLETDGVSGNSRYFYSLLNSLGKSCVTGNFYGNSFILERNGLPAGVYLFLLSDSKGGNFPAVKILLK